MKRIKLLLAMVAVVVVLAGCGKSLASTLTEGDGKWYLSNELTDGEMTLIFESKEDVTVELYGESESTTYSVSEKDKTITLNSPDDEDEEAIEMKVIKIQEDTIEIEISGTEGTLSKE
ncbi:hypothetical protein I6N96_17365 [Enterococcus sp. BWM-S5]|uniref:Lipoprotein n=1 Tax=Enterococcus larvae TaxID=2794352 RepID=A0ABS4CNF1_9ENTE|nr:hypothetical protein [Enterococcus larvae]MBP1048064.1 hypothetical protein [Enterococcus larvae]